MRTAESGGLASEYLRTRDAYVGYRVVDPLGRKVGIVREAYLNPDGRPEYLNVRLGALRLRTVLIPVWEIDADEARRTLRLV